MQKEEQEWRGLTTSDMNPGFEIRLIRLSETCQNISRQVKCPYMVIRGQVHFLLQLENRLTEVTRDSWLVPCRHRSRRCLSCWRAARCSWSRSLLLFHPSVRAPLLGDNTRFSNSSASCAGRNSQSDCLTSESPSCNNCFCSKA